MRKLLLIILSFILSFSSSAQHSLQDTLRGTITPERQWWDVLKYDLTVVPEFTSKTITGSNTITARALTAGRKMQIDLQEPMKITAVSFRKKNLKAVRNGNVFYITLPSPIKAGTVFTLDIDFAGAPHTATNPPWDGGWIWKSDQMGNPWMSVACQVLGASVWYPCKDHQSDEPDSAVLNIIVPDTLVGIGNGRLTGKYTQNTAITTGGIVRAKIRPGQVMYSWTVKNPINSYNIIPYIGKYVNWSDEYDGEKGKLSVNYWVLQENEKKARGQFGQTLSMLKCFEHWFGPYPFYEDGFKLVESPHLGMEHQSNIAYGNRFENGYLGKDLSGTGWGEKWDFIIIHESGHEWFGNNITTKDVADMWVHEGFTNYSEALYTECLFGKAAGSEYCRGLRQNIQNDRAVTGDYGVNKEGSVDMYYKGANLVLMIRSIIDNDEKFRLMLRGMNETFYHQTVTAAQIEDYISKTVGKDLSKVFDQYLRTTQIPEFDHRVKNNVLQYRWKNCVDGFDMPLKLMVGNEDVWIYPTTSWQSLPVNTDKIRVDEDFYIK